MLELAFKQIFPNGNIKEFLHYYSYWIEAGYTKEASLDFALWSYGEIRRDQYLKEKKVLLNLLSGVTI
jgi:hypothetical protein